MLDIDADYNSVCLDPRIVSTFGCGAVGTCRDREIGLRRKASARVLCGKLSEKFTAH